MSDKRVRMCGAILAGLVVGGVLLASPAPAEEKRATVYDAQTAQRKAVVKENTTTGRVEVYDAQTAQRKAVVKENTTTGRVEVYDAQTARRLFYGQRHPTTGRVDLYDAQTSKRKVYVVPTETAR